MSSLDKRKDLLLSTSILVWLSSTSASSVYCLREVTLNFSLTWKIKSVNKMCEPWTAPHLWARLCVLCCIWLSLLYSHNKMLEFIISQRKTILFFLTGAFSSTHLVHWTFLRLVHWHQKQLQLRCPLWLLWPLLVQTQQHQQLKYCRK